MCVGVHMAWHTRGVSSIIPPLCGFQVSNSGDQAFVASAFSCWNIARTHTIKNSEQEKHLSLSEYMSNRAASTHYKNNSLTA